MKVGIKSPTVVVGKALCAFLAGGGEFPDVTEFDSILGSAGVDDKSPPRVLLVHATELCAGIDSVHRLCSRLPDARALLLAHDPDEEFCAAEQLQVVSKALHKVTAGARWFAHRVTSTVIE